MRISLCIPTRGRPVLLRGTLEQTMANAVLPDTKAIVGFDFDDPTQLVPVLAMRKNPQIQLSIAEREDTLGAKYNRLAAARRSDLYVLGVDKMTFATPGWDVLLAEQAEQFSDGIGVIRFGQPPVVGSALSASYAITGTMYDRMGQFMTPLFPFWWHENWLDEIAVMIGRSRRVSVEMAYPENPLQSRGAREIAWWAAFFDATRPLREAAARKLTLYLDEHSDRQKELRDGLAGMREGFIERNRLCRDPVNAKRLEKIYGFDAPNDERYRRVKANAEAVLKHFPAKESNHVAA